MRRAILAFILGVLLGVVAVLGPHVPAETPWPEPTASPSLIELGRELDRLQCEAEKARAVFEERVRLTGAVNPPAWEGR